MSPTITIGDHVYQFTRSGENSAYQFGIYERPSTSLFDTDGVRRYKVLNWLNGNVTVQVSVNGEWVDF